MNRKGQVLVLFVIFIPVLLIIAAFTIDIGYDFYQTNHLNSINRMILRYGLEHIDDSDVRSKMVDLLYKNDDKIDIYRINIEDNKISFEIKKTVDSIFGKAINIDFYYIDSHYVGYIKDGKIIIEKG